MSFTTNSQYVDLQGIPIPDGYSRENNTFPAAAMEPGAYQDSFNNPSSALLLSFFRPLIVQQGSAVTGSAGKALTYTFANNNIAGNSIIVTMGMGEVEAAGITLTVTDSQGNSYSQSTKASQSTTLEAAIFLATSIKAGANVVTITIAGGSSSNTAIACRVYEVWGLIGFVGALDQTGTGNAGSGTSVSTGAVTPVLPNELMIMAISAGGGTITPGTNWTLDSGTLAPVGGNLVSFGSQSRPHSTLAPITPSATLSGSNAWAACCATFKSISVPVQGQVISQPVTGIPVESVVSVGVSSGQVLATDPTRKFLLLQNDSNNIIYLSIGGNTAVVGQGQRLNANGGSLMLDQYVATSAVNAIATAASSNLLVTKG